MQLFGIPINELLPLEEFLENEGMSQAEFAQEIGLKGQSSVGSIIAKRRKVLVLRSADGVLSAYEFRQIGRAS